MRPIDFLNAVLAHRAALRRTTGLVLVLVVAAALAHNALRKHRAVSVFLPEGTEDVGAATSGLLAIVGAAGSGQQQQLALYSRVLTSEGLLRQVAQTEFEVETDGSAETLSGTLVDLYDIEAPSPELALRQAVGRLRESVSVSTDARALLVVLQTDAPWPSLAVDVNRRMLELIEEFNRDRRRSQARAEREFVEERLREAEDSLRAAEAKLVSFLESNVRFDAPTLRFEQSRLESHVALRRQRHTGLAMTYDDALIQEVRNTPLITIIEEPELGVRRAGRHLPLLVVVPLGLLLGLALGAVVARIAEYLDEERRLRPGEFERFQADSRAVLTEIVPGRLSKKARASHG